MNTNTNDEDYLASLENPAVREQLCAELFAVNQITGRSKMADPEYSRLWEIKAQAAFDRQRRVDGMRPEGSPNTPPVVLSAKVRERWERQYTATNERGQLLVEIDPEYRARVERLGDSIFGTARRDHNGRVVG